MSNFWDLDAASASTPALYDEQRRRWFSYGELRAAADAFAAELGTSKRLVFLFADNGFAPVAAYLGALRGGHAVFLATGGLDAELGTHLIETYGPDVIWPAERVPPGMPLRRHSVPDVGELGVLEAAAVASPLHPDLAVLLSTSGTTGSPKLARLTFRNVQANAASIAEYLEQTPSERPITSLPFAYSFGLSVVNSHLLVGASLVATNRPIVLADFWKLFKEHGCTSFAGVPFTYELLERIRFGSSALPTLRLFTQAGGRLNPERQGRFHKLALEKGWRFYVMYGATEATARISYVPWQRLGEKLGSIGIAIPGGRMWIEDEGHVVEQPGEVGELVYEGPNVMLGYAETREDLAKGDELRGVLKPGDLGYRDEDGFFFVTGRKKRFLKIFGLRVNLDEAETMLEIRLGKPVACVGRDDLLIAAVESTSDKDAREAASLIQEVYQIHKSAVRGVRLAALARSSSGKKIYQDIARDAGLEG
jgi:acyl-CoA synthetase (AMP-forming)/AMP-acid ligase II